MPRKAILTIDQERAQIKRKYKRGRKVDQVVTDEQSLTDFDRSVKREIACYLKAQDFTYGYIADTLGLGKAVIRRWFLEDEMKDKVAKIQLDFLDGAVKLMKTYAIEIVEIFMEIVRTTEDPKIVLQAGAELLDRMGLTKVNKSEAVGSVVRTDRTEIDITDTTGVLERARSAPPHVQAQMAQHMESLLALGQEHAEPVADQEAEDAIT